MKYENENDVSGDVFRGANAGLERKISVEEYRDKMKAGWLGQMIGVDWSLRLLGWA